MSSPSASGLTEHVVLRPAGKESPRALPMKPLDCSSTGVSSGANEMEMSSAYQHGPLEESSQRRTVVWQVQMPGSGIRVVSRHRVEVSPSGGFQLSTLRLKAYRLEQACFRCTAGEESA